MSDLSDNKDSLSRRDFKLSQREYVTSLATPLIKANNNNDNDLVDFEIIEFARPSETHRFTSNQEDNNIKSNIFSL